MTEIDLKHEIFDRYPDLVNVRALAWKGGLEIPSSSIVGVVVIPAHQFDGWHHLPVRDVELRNKAQAFLKVNAPARINSYDDDAILVLAVLQ